MVGVNGKKFPQIREHLQDKIGDAYKDMDVRQVGPYIGSICWLIFLSCSFNSFPNNETVDPEAYKAAIDGLAPGAAVIIFTPDSMSLLPL